MKNQLILVLALLSLGFSAAAQKEYKLSKSTGRITFNINGAIIEGYSGTEIVFTSAKNDNEPVDDRAKGLRAISGSGFADNTGLGIEVVNKGEEVTVNSVNKHSDVVLTIKVPQGMKISFNNSSSIYHNDITLKNLKNEIEVSTSYNQIKLENNTGPMNVKTLYGSVDAVFASDIKGPVSIVSVYGYVDVSMPNATKANVEMGTNYGKLYAADAFKIVMEKPAEKAPANKNEVTIADVSIVAKPAVSATMNGVQITGISGSTGATINNTRRVNGVNIAYATSREVENIKGKINGGGTDLIFKSTYQNVYLRDK